MIPNQELIHEIWSHSPAGFHFFATLHRPEGLKEGKYTDYLTSDDWPLADQPHEHDLFFAPLAFNRSRRSNETVTGPGVLFADIDKGEPFVPPSVWWETSPGNTQAIWFLAKSVEDYDIWADLNRRMTYASKADKGGWMGSKMLRVPGSINWKRRAFGKLLELPRTIYTFELLDEALPNVSTLTGSITNLPFPELPDPKDRNVLLHTYWDRMTLLGRSMITQGGVRDRSLHIVRTAYELSQGGLNPEAIFKLIWVAPWCKWRTDRDAPERLWLEVLRAAG